MQSLSMGYFLFALLTRGDFSCISTRMFCYKNREENDDYF